MPGTCGGHFSLPTDPTMTTKSVLAALESVSDRDVKFIFETPDTKWRRNRTAVVDYYLSTSPKASWERLAGRCLYLSQKSPARAIIEGRPKPEEGMEIYRVGSYLFPC